MSKPLKQKVQLRRHSRGKKKDESLAEPNWVELGTWGIFAPSRLCGLCE